MADVADRLQEETEKWQSKLDDALDDVKPPTSEQREYLANVEAYRDDSDHFLEQGDLVRAFEAVIWAWAWLEIGMEQGILD